MGRCRRISSAWTRRCSYRKSPARNPFQGVKGDKWQTHYYHHCYYCHYYYYYCYCYWYCYCYYCCNS